METSKKRVKKVFDDEDDDEEEEESEEEESEDEESDNSDDDDDDEVLKPLAWVKKTYPYNVKNTYQVRVSDDTQWLELDPMNDDLPRVLVNPRHVTTVTTTGPVNSSSEPMEISLKTGEKYVANMHTSDYDDIAKCLKEN